MRATARLKVTVKVRGVVVPAAPSATRGASAVSVGGGGGGGGGRPSSSAIVPVPVPPPGAKPAFTGLLNRTTTVSSGSAAPSPMTDAAKVCTVSPGAKVSVPGARAV